MFLFLLSCHLQRIKQYHWGWRYKFPLPNTFITTQRQAIHLLVRVSLADNTVRCPPKSLICRFQPRSTPLILVFLAAFLAIQYSTAVPTTAKSNVQGSGHLSAAPIAIVPTPQWVPSLYLTHPFEPAIILAPTKETVPTSLIIFGHLCKSYPTRIPRDLTHEVIR